MFSPDVQSETEEEGAGRLNRKPASQTEAAQASLSGSVVNGNRETSGRKY